MKKQAFNPYLPSYEYVPDGEPHVFGSRLYVFGSHDEFNGNGFCIRDYVCWSAPVDDLSDWRYDGVMYRRTQDPVNPKGKKHMNAPDVCLGPDGRYYLYYQLHTEVSVSVAVAERPEGPYSFYGNVKHPDGTLYGKKKGDAYAFDPGLLADDDGRVYLYTGFAPAMKGMKFVMGLRGGELEGGYVVELEQDMLTVKGSQYDTIPGPFHCAGTPYDGHAFFEASSIRKIGNTYYLVYSSINSHDLCYATSPSPVGPWKYGGVLVSIGDIGYRGNTEASNYLGNTHGGMVQVKGQWYIFYHRQTNKQKCCRQGCAEKITIAADGSIAQAEVTSCGLNQGPLAGTGRYEARIACNLGCDRPAFAYVQLRHKDTHHPYFTQSGGDREKNGDQYIANLQNGAWAGFKYFDFHGEDRVTLRMRGEGSGKMLLTTEKNGPVLAEIPVSACGQWRDFSAPMRMPEGMRPVFLRFSGTGAWDLDSMEFSS